jgi:hypothetical protein
VLRNFKTAFCYKKIHPQVLFLSKIRPDELNMATDEAAISSIVGQLSVKEMIEFLSGETTFYRGSSEMMSPGGYASRPWVAARNQRVGMAGIKFVDGPRGIVLKGGTTFPVSSMA